MYYIVTMFLTICWYVLNIFKNIRPSFFLFDYFLRNYKLSVFTHYFLILLEKNLLLLDLEFLQVILYVPFYKSIIGGTLYFNVNMILIVKPQCTCDQNIFNNLSFELVFKKMLLDTSVTLTNLPIFDL